MDLYVVDESDCCGNGCANCILDANEPSSSNRSIINLEENINCLHTYNFYELLFLEYVVPDILKMRFQLKHENIEKGSENLNNREKNVILYVPPGHHIMMKTASCRRPYTPFWIDIENFQFELLINTRPNGIMSKYIRQLKLGDLVEFKGPIGSFYHEIDKYDCLLIFSNGVAVASVVPIIEQILNNEDDMTRIYYFGCFSNLDNYYFRDKFLNYKQYWNFDGKIYLAREMCQKESCVTLERNINENRKNGGWCEHLREKLKYNEKIFNYRLSSEEIFELLKNIKLSSLQVIICGSKDFENFIKNSLENCGINKKLIHVL